MFIDTTKTNGTLSPFRTEAKAPSTCFCGISTNFYGIPIAIWVFNQQNTTFDSRYKFTAKEHDQETNYTYFGARYYDADLSVWLSVDPLSDKYPNVSAYAYCNWNPVKFIDPDGMSWDPSELSPGQQETWNTQMKAACALSPLFKTVYDVIDKSLKPYKVTIGNTKFDAQYDSENDILAFKDERSMSNPNVFIEEIFHTFQDEITGMKDSKINYEFEARVAKYFILGQMGGDKGFYDPKFYDLARRIDAATGNKIFSFKLTPQLEKFYNSEANSWSNNNNSINYGNKNYKKPTYSKPKSLYKMFWGTK